MYQSMIFNKLDLLFASRYQNNSGSEDDTIITFIGNLSIYFYWKNFFQIKYYGYFIHVCYG